MGYELIPGDAGVVGRSASHFRWVADRVGQVRGTLVSARDSEWGGDAADKFRDALGEFPGKFTTVHEAFHEVGDALTAYERDLMDYQDRQQALIGRSNQARRNELSYRDQQSAANPDDASSYDSYIESARAEADWLERQVQQLYDEWKDGPVRVCANRIRDAADLAFADWWDRYVADDFGGFMKGVGSFAWNVVKGIGKAIIDLPGALLRLDEALAKGFLLGQWDLKEVVKDLGDVLGDLTVIASVAVIFAPELAPLVFALNAAKMGDDVAQGKDFKTIAFDGLNVALSGVSAVAGRGVDAAEGASEAQAAWRSEYSAALRGGDDLQGSALSLSDIDSKFAQQLSGLDGAGDATNSLREMGQLGTRQTFGAADSWFGSGVKDGGQHLAEWLTHPKAAGSEWWSDLKTDWRGAFKAPDGATGAMVNMHRIDLAADTGGHVLDAREAAHRGAGEKE